VIRSENLRSGYIQDDVEDYIYNLLPERDAVVREMESYAEEHRIPIIGPAVARMLALFVQVSGAKRIFEMGSAIGYSTIWLARAAGAKAKVTYTDGDVEKARRAKEYFQRAAVAKRIEVRIGDAMVLAGFRAMLYAARTIRYWLFGEAFGRSFRDCFLPGLLFSITPPTKSVRSVSLTQNSSSLPGIKTLANSPVDSSTTTVPALLWLCVASRLFFIMNVSRCIKKTQ